VIFSIIHLLKFKKQVFIAGGDGIYVVSSGNNVINHVNPVNPV